MDTARTRRGVVGAVVGVVWIAGLFAVAPLVGGFAIDAIAQRAIALTPGWISSTFIGLLGHWAQPLLVASVLVGIVGLAAVVGAIWSAIPGPTAAKTNAAIAAEAVATATLLWIAGSPPSLGFLVAIAIAVGPAALAPRLCFRSTATQARRSFLKRVGAVLGGGAVAFGLGRVAADRVAGPVESERVREPLDGTDRPDTEPVDDEFGFDFGEMPAVVTPPEDHYVVDQAVENPTIRSENWSLDVTGAVESPYALSYDELLDHDDAVEQTVTMVCISNSVGGDLIGTAHWTGVQLSDLVAAGDPTDEAVDVVTYAADGYSEAIPIEMAEREDILVAYGMGDRTLAAERGFPARLIVPGRYGMKMTKWITDIEVSTGDHEAYWEERGWDEEAIMNTMSYVRAAERRDDRIAVGGVAFSGMRDRKGEISTVEVSVDGGESWNETELEEPLSEHARRRWRYVFKSEDREFEVVARAIDGEGDVQTEERSDPRPGGATGWHRFEVSV